MSSSRYPSPEKPYRYIKITINKKEIFVTNTDNYISFPVMDADIRIFDEYEKKSLCMKWADLNDQTVSFFDRVNEEYDIEFDFPENGTSTKLPVAMTANLIKFFKLYRPKPNVDYCCISFAYEMTYGRNAIKNHTDSSYFNEKSSRLFSEEKLSNGDLVHLYDSISFCNKDFLKENHHYAIYIGEKYYLSLAGEIGPLMISTLDAVKKGFQAKTCSQVLPKKIPSTLAKNCCKFGIFALSVTIAVTSYALLRENNFKP